jgi:ABC-type dipeptide/oligopeptide/nickel transport system permease subunit
MVVLLSVGFALVGEALSDIYNPRRWKNERIT